MCVEERHRTIVELLIYLVLIVQKTLLLFIKMLNSVFMETYMVVLNIFSCRKTLHPVHLDPVGGPEL